MVAVMVAVPAFFAVTFPPELTVATVFRLELHLIFCLVPVNFNWAVPFTFSVRVSLFNEGVSTVTLHTSLFFPNLAVIAAVPFFFAVTFPLLFTEAMLFWLDDQVIFPVAPVTFRV